MPIIEDITNAIKIQIKSLMPVNLDKECDKAAKTLQEFVFDSNLQVKNPIISPETIKKAKGLVILTIGKAGISFTIRGGSGILISRLSDGTWSAPSAVKTGGFGVGSQIGAEIIELVMVLTTNEAVKNFCENENITLGGNLSVAIGEVGRAAEINSTVKNVSAIISYGKSKGAYVGMSVEGAVIQQNDDANATAYGKEVTVENILNGNVPKPEYAKPLYNVLEKIEQYSNTKKITDKKTENKTIEKTETPEKVEGQKDEKSDDKAETDDKKTQ
ncbi:DUF500-domain-containing protein [Neocallimastix lanati (nom. inval.)]|jgi:lipid-binding SYLF domain-containing protein|uniref:DUF500-domain-containing protein n=1 Tax=Neocallimastix californiae TaxID=1754190 RepID=A0A1Y2C0N5_9FUNG|nr:DUF500-domain-containing protein [Neocallimastix sp. JGI-2020a]ORY40580.1 DUF500-domain-containing protein [Neocallimastix californiae]|eukprot:ORY40580.1 DUF500-domain-containing protein [Neocallimastix californiae]